MSDQITQQGAQALLAMQSQHLGQRTPPEQGREASANGFGEMGHPSRPIEVRRPSGNNEDPFAQAQIAPFGSQSGVSGSYTSAFFSREGLPPLDTSHIPGSAPSSVNAQSVTAGIKLPPLISPSQAGFFPTSSTTTTSSTTENVSAVPQAINLPPPRPSFPFTASGTSGSPGSGLHADPGTWYKSVGGGGHERSQSSSALSALMDPPMETPATQTMTAEPTEMQQDAPAMVYPRATYPDYATIEHQPVAPQPHQQQGMVKDENDLHTHRPLPNWSEISTFPTANQSVASSTTYHHPYGNYRTTYNRSPMSDGRSTSRGGSHSPPFSFGNTSPMATLSHSRSTTDASVTTSAAMSVYGVSPPRTTAYMSSHFGPIRSQSPGAERKDKMSMPPPGMSGGVGMVGGYPFQVGDIIMRSQQGGSSEGSGEGGRRGSDLGDTRRGVSPGEPEMFGPGDAEVGSGGLDGSPMPARTREEARQEARKARIESEQRRRDELREGFKVLKRVLPASNQRASKSSLLERSVNHIQQIEAANKLLFENNQRLEAENRRLQDLNHKLVEAQTKQLNSSAGMQLHRGFPDTNSHHPHVQLH